MLSKNAKNTRHDAVNMVMNRAATMINIRDPASSRLSSPAHIELEYVLARSSAKTPSLQHIMAVEQQNTPNTTERIPSSILEGRGVIRGHDFLPTVAMIWERGLATGC